MGRKVIFVVSLIITTLILNLLFVYTSTVWAAEDITYISLSDNEILVGENKISTNSEENIYLSSSMNNGGDSEEAQAANIQIANIININNSGIYEFSGSLSDGQIAINANKIVGNVTIILNNINIICKNAPAIFIYNTTTNSSACSVTIKTKESSENTISGGKIKQSVENWADQDKILYYIEKGYDDDRSYYERYKYDGAISSDISLTFEGEGTLTVNALQKEGIETKRDITINSGNYIINSLDDGINACTDNESIININGGTILVNVMEEAEEGDGIDSNGYIYINGGNVYAFASESSQDNGLDSDSGTYINGGNVVSTGNMADEIKDDSKQEFITLQFSNKVSKESLITITDENKNPMVAFKSDRSYRILTLSTSKIENGEYSVYEGGTINGTSENGLYTEITFYEGGTERTDISKNSDMDSRFKGMPTDNVMAQSQKTNMYYLIIGLIIILCIFIVIYIKLKDKEKLNMKDRILILIIGILIGAIITTGIFMIYNKTVNIDNDQRMMRGQMQEKGEKPDGEMPAKPDGNNQMFSKPNSSI